MKKKKRERKAAPKRQKSLKRHVLSEEILAMLKRRRRACFLCSIILRDYEKNKTLTRHPESWDGESVFPVKSKLKHIKKERSFEDETRD